ncbi:MAG: 6-phosphogluconate dehydrogenase (decarboxylating) [Acidobacteria bacterium 13_1_40CM_65_14]|nr:MAG: 6-phosphogluconate dehydrogenase (decarboxylating) [Acidobacteria bacterium 13_1_40CM_65_14]OLD13957.1 MAG: 6-phosphogluconate dehydrogenase (decarboxylating) [Acidobacteria bacterium 13_1_40CM_3_65_5]
MQLGFVGLGRMGLNMVTRLVRGGHEIVAYDRSAEAIARAESAGARGVASLEALPAALTAPRGVWVMVPAGAPTESTIAALGNLLSAGDAIVDGGNTNFHDDVRRAEALSAKHMHYVDAGVSGGIWGLQEGYCLMVGGEADVCTRLEPIFLTLAPKDGYLHVGDHGAGHYVKMIHNGIEYGLMQAYAEGFELMHASAYTIDLAAVAALWNHGSVVRSWLLELAARALAEDAGLSGLEGYVEDSGEGRWTVQDAIERAVPLPVITAALFTRFRSREDNPFAERMLAALRNQFGGHPVKKRDA